MSRKNRIHITGGRYKGSVIPSPKSGAVRPTPSMVRMAIFNMLQSDVEGADVLELFAGMGTLGFEALSREAAFATFVECDAAACRLIRDTAGRLGCADRTSVLQLDAFEAMDAIEGEDRCYRLIFLDPPYAHTREIVPGTPIRRLIRGIVASPCVDDGARCFLQHPRGAPIDLGIEGIQLSETRPYGSTAITIFTCRRGG